MKSQWHFYNSDTVSNLQQVQETLLSSLQLDVSELESFVHPPHPSKLSLESLSFDSDQLKNAIQLIQKSIDTGDEIVIYGDYDADGICATSMTWQVLKSLGANVWPFLPHRERHGYGLSPAALEELWQERAPKLLITVDTGIVAHEHLEWLTQHHPETQVIITDHHQPELLSDGLVHWPAADAVVHSTKLCGATVAWMLLRELAGAQACADQLDLCAIATISDQVPLKEANRSFAWHGLRALRTSQRVGIQALCEVAQVKQESCSERDIGFGLGPRINAMGRLAHGMDALRLLCTTKAQAAQELAQVLTSTNKDRQDLTEDQFQHALELAREQSDQSLIVVGSEEYHEGVIGLIAGRITQELHKPSLVFSINQTYAKASARSVPGINIIELVREVHDQLLSVGGHPMAAGLSVDLDRYSDVVAQLQEFALKSISPDALIPRLPVLTTLDPALLTPELPRLFDQFRPWGSANPEPLFALPAMTLVSVSRVGQRAQHLKLSLMSDAQSRPLTVMCWGKGEHADTFTLDTPLRIVGKIQLSVWKNRESVQVIGVDWE